MVDASELRLSATEYTEAEYQLAKLVAKEVPIDQDARLLFFAEVDRCEERVRARSSCKDLDEGIAFITSTGCTTYVSDQVDQTTSRNTATRGTKASDPSNHVGNTRGVIIRGPLLPTGHLRKLVRIQAEVTEWSVNKVHKKLDHLISLIQSHYETTKALPKAHDDIKEMLLEQAERVEELHTKFKKLAQLLDDQDTTDMSTVNMAIGDNSGRCTDGDETDDSLYAEGDDN
ncbi:hypothetical protein VMCG_08201 [Cytospora schulzeri]|uniref:Uncharacterized protein n=1 Tax=Cytospora schulzeri TaxID=448051 RepID=A0A423VUE0_9PEZI|nr:hypothetical protein VMCG_08201 [Valsa malicola]